MRRRQDPPITLFTEKTLAEKLTGRFDMSEKPTPKQIKRVTICFILCVFFLFFGWSSASACEPVPSVNMENGAGNTWTCSNCGNTNYCWQISCGNCGKS